MSDAGLLLGDSLAIASAMSFAVSQRGHRARRAHLVDGSVRDAPSRPRVPSETLTPALVAAAILGVAGAAFIVEF